MTTRISCSLAAQLEARLGTSIRSQSLAMGGGHITGFSGSATFYPGAQSTIGQYNDAGLAFGPNNVLFVTRYFANQLGQLEQSKVGSMGPDKVIDLTPLGVTG